LVTGFVDVGTLATTALLIYAAVHHISQRTRISSVFVALQHNGRFSPAEYAADVENSYRLP
jgi:hypothetical protein